MVLNKALKPITNVLGETLKVLVYSESGLPMKVAVGDCLYNPEQRIIWSGLNDQKVRFETIMGRWNEYGEDPAKALEDLYDEISSYFEIKIESSKKLVEMLKLLLQTNFL